MIARRTKIVILMIALLGGAATFGVISPPLGTSKLQQAAPAVSPTTDPMNRLLTHFESVGSAIPAPRRDGERDSDNLPGPADFLAHQFATRTPRPAAVQQAAPAVAPQTGGSTSNADSSPFVDTLRELQERETPIPFNQRIYGARTNNTPLPTPTPVGSPTITPTPTVTGTPPLQRVGGMPTGYTMLYLMQPRARATVERQIQFMLDSQVNDLYLAVLADGNSETDPVYPGTFGTDFAYLSSVVRRLNH